MVVTGSGGDHRSRLRQELLTRMFDDNVMELLLVIAQHAHARPFKSEAPLLMEIFQQVFKAITAHDLARAAAPAAPHQQPGHSTRATARPKGCGMASERAAMERQIAKLRHSSAAPARHARFGGLYVKRYHSEDRGSVLRTNPLMPNLPAIPELKKTSKTQVEGRPAAQVQAQLLWKLRQYLEQLLQAGSLGVVMQAVLQDLKAGLHISRLSRDHFVCFFRLAQLATAYVRIQQEKALRQKHDAQKMKQQRTMVPTNNADTADSSHAAAATAAIAALPPADMTTAAAEPAPNTSADQGKPSAEGGGSAGSPFACVSAILGWETFHMVHVLWIGLVDLPGKAPEKDWEMQHESLGMLKEMLFALDLALHVGTPADKKAADRLQRRLLHDDMKESGLLPVTGRLLKSFNFAYQPRSHAVDLVQALHVILRMLDRLNTTEAGGFLVKQKGRAGGGRKKKPQPASREGTPDRVEGFHADAAAPEGQGNPSLSPSPASPAVKGGRTGNPFDEEEREAEEEARRRQVREVAYDLQRRVKQELAFPAVIHFYCWLLQGFATNGAFLNHCLVAYLRRISDPAGLDLEPMLYQLSVLRVFQAVLSDKGFRKQEGAGEVIHLATHVTRNLFTRLAPDNPYEDDDMLLDELDLSEEEGKDAEAVKKREARKRLKMEAEVRQKASAMMFIELMFWKNASVAESVRDDYNWRDMYDKQRGRKRGMGSDADSDGDQLGFGSSRPRKEIMCEEQARELQEIFEEVNGMKDCLQRCVTGMAGTFKKSQISRQLKAMGLKRNRLTHSQEERLKGLYQKHQEDRGYLAILAEDLPGSFSKGQIASQLRKLGLKKSKGKKARGMAKAGSQASSSASGSGTDSHSDSDSDSSADSQPERAEQDLQATHSNGDEQVPVETAAPGSKAAKQKKSSASKKAKKQKRDGEKASHGNINDWSSDDSGDAEPAPGPDQVSPMSDRQEHQEDAPADKRERASAGKKKQSDQQSAGRKRSKAGELAHRKSKSSGSTGKHAHAKHAKASDWTLDDSSGAEPETIPDHLEPMSDSDVDDSRQSDRAASTSARRQHNVASSLHQHGKKQVAGMRMPAEPSQQDPPRAQMGKGNPDRGQPAAISDDEALPAQQAQRRGRLRKARASPASAQYAAAAQEADDIMVDLEDDLPGVEMEEAELLSVARGGADDKLSEEDTSGDEAASEEDTGAATKSISKSMGVAGQESDKGAEKHVGKHQDKQSRADTEDKAPGEEKSNKRLKKQVDLPHAARSALDILTAQRLQKHFSRPAPAASPTLAFPPLQDTLPLSEPPSDPSQSRDSSPSQGPPQPSEIDVPPVDSTMPSSAMDLSSGGLESEPNMPPLNDTAVDFMDTTDMQSAEHAPQVRRETGGKALLHEGHGMPAGRAGSIQEEVGGDELLMQQVVDEELAGAGHSSPAPGQDDDDEALLHSLLNEAARASTSC
ncbi:hypothetical protein ABBQ32_010265 [Trebouxia sp. C0010 RCD-2024]